MGGGAVLRLAGLMLAVLVLLACSPATAKAPTPDSVLAAFKAAGLPIAETVIWTADSDPDKLLGRPNQYVASASWHDSRLPFSEGFSTDSGGTVEIFASEADLKTRRDYIEAIAKAPLIGGHRYTFARDRVLLRVSGALTPDQAAEYERALATLN